MILGIDPGRDKTGWAMVHNTGNLAAAGIFHDGEWPAFIEAVSSPAASGIGGLGLWIKEKCGDATLSNEKVWKLDYIALGNGTGSLRAGSCLEALGSEIVLVDERGTTLAARDLYWYLYPPSFWRRCFPRFLWGPSRALDDFAAWAIALRSIKDSGFLRSDSDLGRLINSF